MWRAVNTTLWSEVLFKKNPKRENYISPIFVSLDKKFGKQKVYFFHKIKFKSKHLNLFFFCFSYDDHIYQRDFYEWVVHGESKYVFALVDKRLPFHDAIETMNDKRFMFCAGQPK